ncbi:hypothetical protein [Bacteroides gallinarum]|uniref:hypothetical protein n=1 Tax=Bacteroides gallinarum TaxID=376806 RepID=UPI00037DEB58|nr:hypothetical protein [Bacteroides gallinarum]
MTEDVSIIDPIVDFIAKWIAVPGIALYGLYLIYKLIKSIYDSIREFIENLFGCKHSKTNQTHRRHSNDSTHKYENENKEQLYEIRIKGTIQCNGPKPISKTFIGDRLQAQMFTGSRRREALEDWVRANYPGADPQSGRNLAAEVKPLK